MDFLNFLFKIGCVEYILFESPSSKLGAARSHIKRLANTV